MPAGPPKARAQGPRRTSDARKPHESLSIEPFGRSIRANSSSGSGSSRGIRLPRRRRRVQPGPGAPRVDPDLETIARPPSELQLTWLGHASFLVQLAGFNLLVDPILSTRRLRWRKRHVPPGLRVQELPEIHLLLVTHGHDDHLNEWTIKRLSRHARVVVPEGLGRRFLRLGFERISELEPWQPVAPVDTRPDGLDHTEGISITLTPARHGLDEPCGGFVVESSRHALYHAGDTAFFRGFEEIGRRFPGLDAALLPVGSYRRDSEPDRRLNPEEAGRAFLHTGARRLVPMHWGTYQLSNEPLREGPDRLRTWWSGAGLGSDRELVEMAVGETLGWS